MNAWNESLVLSPTLAEGAAGHQGATIAGNTSCEPAATFNFEGRPFSIGWLDLLRNGKAESRRLEHLAFKAPKPFR
jgi:hypothetical protein